MSGEFLADSLHSESDLNLHNGAVFKNAVSLDSARIAGQLVVTGASFKNVVSLSGAKVTGQLLMPGATMRCYLLMQSDHWRDSSFKTVDIGGATVAGNVSMIGASFDPPLIAGLLKVGGNLEMGSLTAETRAFLEPNAEVVARISVQKW